jgi:aspartate-semialdehyde dehydrogenase
MKPPGKGYRVAVVGSSSLLGKELLNVLEERSFPVSRLVTFEADEEEAGLPIVDLSESQERIVGGEELTPADFDFTFVAAPPRSLEEGSALLRTSEKPRSFLIDLSGTLDVMAGEPPSCVPRIPALERILGEPAPAPDFRVFISPHPAAIVLCRLLLSLAARCTLKSAVAQIFSSVSELGPRAIEELQKQTVSLLSFQKLPQTVFGAQLGFNLLARPEGAKESALADLDCEIRRQLRAYLQDRTPQPALRTCLVPVFYSLAVSLYVETTEPVSPTTLHSALTGGGICVRRPADAAPSQVEAAGSSEIQVDTVSPDPDHATGAWIWAVVDNIRLAAVNAVEIAETLREQARA